MQGFFEKYTHIIIPEPNSGCWLWMGAQGAGGYGRGKRNNVRFSAHRAAYESVHGTGSAHGLEVMHACDTPACCNPDHLELGTHRQNMRDAHARGRIANGHRIHAAKLTEEKVREIRNLYRDGMRIAHIRRTLNLTHVKWNTVKRAATGRHWARI